MRIAIVHDWLTGMRGGEKVLSLICRLYPRADLYTLLHTPGSCDAVIESMRIRTSLLDDLPGIRRYYRHLLPILPMVAERFDLSDYDLVLSSSHCVAKGVLRSPRARHLCYCYTPMRYAWSQSASYRRTMGPVASMALGAMGPYLRAWDRRSAGHVDRFLAVSQCVAERIARTYGRDAHVVYPPVDTGFYTPGDVEREDFYLVLGALAPYKRADQAVEAFTRLGRPLRVIGSGQMLPRLRRQGGANVRLLGALSDEEVRDHLRRCRALVFPQEEDFGIVPLEAMACGAPVIAYGGGGAMETVRDVGKFPLGATGLLYTPQSTDALCRAIEQFEQLGDVFDGRALVEWAGRFGPGRFMEAFKRHVDDLLAE